uniref:Uncharacterized protein n=1 Tax=Arundo donax TaxID=35708 RepID=A0A0A8YAL2_ARUDO
MLFPTETHCVMV